MSTQCSSYVSFCLLIHDCFHEFAKMMKRMYSGRQSCGLLD
uniref:Uncharacterized protein n=1 Tax=Anguilla anguilla TaxID=7936 RepID=A0A0E9WT85_ANGAN